MRDADVAELQRLRADRDARETVERRALVTELVAIGAETPASAWDQEINGPAAHLAAGSMDLPALRAHVEAMRAARPASSLPPAVTPPPIGVGLGEEALEDYERRDAEKIKDPDARARFVASRLARKKKKES
jgi:hypothetical protein